MAETKPPKKPSEKRAAQAVSTKHNAKGFTADERAAMKERARELKAEARAAKTKADGIRDVLAKIAELPRADRVLAEWIHAIVKASAPDLAPRTWYGMPAYANRDGKVVRYFTPASKFKERYASFGFNASANLDDGTMWPTSFAVTELTRADEKRIAAITDRSRGILFGRTTYDIAVRVSPRDGFRLRRQRHQWRLGAEVIDAAPTGTRRRSAVSTRHDAGMRAASCVDAWTSSRLPGRAVASTAASHADAAARPNSIV